ncbi:MAG TPA: hypothetical protein VGJ45_12185 [Pseudonocardiaceae bacterium]|jgi:hypothetical protein
MSGHLDQAAAVLNSAAQQVPVETVLGAENQLTTVTAYIQTAGGHIAESLSSKALAMQQEAHEFAGRLVALRGDLEEAARQVLASGS